MRQFVMIIFALTIASSLAQPILPGLGSLSSRSDNDDLLSFEADLLGFFLRLLLGGGGGEGARSRESFNPLQLVQLGASFLRTLGNLEGGSGGSNDIRNDASQDPRVLNYEREINQRNQLAGLARVFSGFLGRR